MKFMHISDVHLGVKPDAGKAWSEKDHLKSAKNPGILLPRSRSFPQKNPRYPVLFFINSH